VAAATVVSSARAASATQSLTTAINSFVPGAGGFVGTLTVNSFTAAGNVLNAVVTLAGNVLNSAGSVTGTLSATHGITIPLQVSGSCQILTLILGPLDLNLLGLKIHLNQIVLNITAAAGAGNLLGNLLCDVANLLNAGGPLDSLLMQLSTLLNNILAAL